MDPQDTHVSEEYVEGMKFLIHRPKRFLKARKLLIKLFGTCKHNLYYMYQDSTQHVFWCTKCGCIAIQHIIWETE